jgi:N-acetylneuraminic acid mutarotase
MERFPIKIPVQADGPVSQGAQVGDEERAAANWSRRRFIAGVAVGAGALALPAMVRASVQPVTIDQDDWTHNTDCDRGFFLGQVVQQLKDGRVMVIGGFDENWNNGGDRNRFYHPDTDKWSVAPSLPGDKIICSALGWALLKNGKLLVGGGEVVAGFDNPGDNGKCYLFDPETNTWEATGDIPETIWGNTPWNPMVLLDNGNVLCIGARDSTYEGPNGGPNHDGYQSAIRKSYLYHTSAGTWSATGLMAHAHEAGFYFPLPGNKAIVIGGYLKFAPGPAAGNFASFSNTSEIYSGGSFSGSTVLPPVTRRDHTGEDDMVSAGLKGGRARAGAVATRKYIVLVGGQYGSAVDSDGSQLLYRSSIIVYDIQANCWAVSRVAMPYKVTESLCFALDDDNILIAGGENWDIGGLPTPRTFIFCISKATLTPSTDMPTVFRNWELSPGAGPVGLLPYNYPDENQQGAIALQNGSFLSFCGLDTASFDGTPGGLGDTLTPDKKRGKPQGRGH